MKGTTFAAAALIAAASLQSQALADGSIAIAQPADDSGFSIGVSYNWESRAGADAEAFRQCQSREAGLAPEQRAVCRLAATYDNQCMALAKDEEDGGTAWGWGIGADQVEADGVAMRQCRNYAGARGDYCRITMRHCDGAADGGK